MITRGDAVGGASIHVRDLARAVRERGWEAHVFLGGSGPVTEQLLAAGVPWTAIGSLRRQIAPWHDVRAAFQLRSALRRFHPSLVSAHTAKAGWLARAAAASLGIPTIYTPHGWSIDTRISPRQGAIYTVAERIAARWAAAIVCVSQSERQLALRRRVGHPDQLRVIYNGVRDIVPDLRAHPGATPVRLISVARFEPPKDHLTLLRALSRLRDLPWHLELTGDGPGQPAAAAAAESLKIAERIHWSGYQRDPAPSLARAQIFVLSSRSEGFPRSILEAMRAGLPVVATDVGGVGESVINSESGLLVPAGDPVSLANSLERLIKSASERQQLGQNGRRLYEERFKFESTLLHTLELYAEVPGVHERQ